jgi:hypothetical protein
MEAGLPNVFDAQLPAPLGAPVSCCVVLGRTYHSPPGVAGVASLRERRTSITN